MSDQENHIFAAILAGGSGTRFWPASRRLVPKQLLPLAPGSDESLLRDTVTRLHPLIENGRVYVSTGTHLLEATERDVPALSEAQFLAEPQAKNTAPCIAWAAQVVAQRDPDAILCVLPSDQHASDDEGFRQTLKRAAEATASGAIVTIGIVPTRPETGYGYIKRGGAEGEAYVVDGFFEKPDLKTAQSYLADGNFLWNAGIFVFRVRDMLAAVREHLPEVATALDALAAFDPADTVNYQVAVARYFDACPKISIDYGVMEKASLLRVVPGDFGWSDLGSWESAWELAEKDERGNVTPSSTVLVDAERNLVQDLRKAEGKRVIALVGVSDLCVIETDDALLVLPRERSQDVRAVVDELKNSGRGELV